jgi:hypothetical protein
MRDKENELGAVSTEDTQGIQEVSRSADKAKPRTLRQRLVDGETPIHNFQGEGLEKWQFLARMTGSDTLKSNDAIGKMVDPTLWYVHLIEMEDKKTGELTMQPRVAIMARGGQVYSFVSWGIVDALDTLREVFGDGPYDERVKFTVEQVNTRGGNRTFAFKPII